MWAKAGEESARATMGSKLIMVDRVKDSDGMVD